MDNIKEIETERVKVCKSCYNKKDNIIGRNATGNCERNDAVCDVKAEYIVETYIPDKPRRFK